MKKRNLIVTSLLLVMAFAMALCGCAGSSYSRIKAAYEGKEYEESAKIEEYQTMINNALGEDFESACNVHCLRNGLNVALILEFKSTTKMEEAFENSETLKGFLKDLDDKGVTEAIQNCELVNGNCVLLFYTPLSNALDIFKNA